MKTLSLAMLAFVLTTYSGVCAAAAPADDKHTVEFRLAEKDPGEDREPHKILDRVGKIAETIYVQKVAVATQLDVASAKVIKDGDKGYFAIEITFTKEGAKKMADATGKSIGKRLTIVVDGKGVFSPTLQSTIGDTARVTGTFDKVAAEKLAASMQPK